MALSPFNPIGLLNGAVSSVGNEVRDFLGIGKTKSNATSQAMFSLDDFKGEVLGNGLAEEDRFEVLMGVPPCLAGGNPWGQSMQSSLKRVESTSFPPMTLFVKQRKIFGAASQVPVSLDYGGESGLSITFLVDRDMNTKKMFDAWMGSIVDLDSQTVAYPASYSTTITLNQLDRTDGVVYQTQITDAYPKIIGPMTLAMTSQGAYHRLTITFAYRKWKCLQVTQQALSAQSEAASLVANGGNMLQSVTSKITAQVGLFGN
jgi:hypothetical protein